MKEKLYTIPLNDAANADDECLFCYLERELERDQLDFVLGSCASYMEADVREVTDQEGFCRKHLKDMFDYGNTLGNAWILKTHYMRLREHFGKATKDYTAPKSSISDRILKRSSSTNPISAFVNEYEASCYICKRNQEVYARYIDTFFYLYDKDSAFKSKIQSGKGFCLTHLGYICAEADKRLYNEEKQSFFNTMIGLTNDNLARIQEDINWMVEKFDYRNKDADWKSSKDAIQRGMQKVKGGYPADKPYKPTK